jgi:hypothetical protein
MHQPRTRVTDPLGAEYDIVKLLRPVADRYGYSTVTGICGYTSADIGLQIHICNHQAELLRHNKDEILYHMLSDFSNLEGGAKRDKWRVTTTSRGILDFELLHIVVD